MSVKTNAIIKAAVAIGHGSASDYSGKTVVAVLKELAVVLECAASVKEIPYNSIVGVLNYIADNYGSEEKEPYDLTVTPTHATVTVKRGNKNLSPAADILYNGDKLKITVAADEGYEVTTLTVNGESIESGDTVTVNGHNITVIATGTLAKFDLERTVENCSVAVTKGGQAVLDGEDALTYGDEITITATATEGYEMTELKVNGETFTSGETLTVSGDVTITATAETQG